MFDNINPEKNESAEKPEKLINIPQNLVNKFLPKKTDIKKISPPVNDKLDFNQRINGLRAKGKKRGKRYFIITVSISVVVTTLVVFFGYWLLAEVKIITNKVDQHENENVFKDIIDPDGRCDDSCCLASLEKIKNNKYTEVDDKGECPLGQEVKQLNCDNSLKWCIPTKSDECVLEGNIVSSDSKFLCCAGLREDRPFHMVSDNGYCTVVPDSFACIACPNGECGPTENKCNCPEDCNSFIATSTEMLPVEKNINIDLDNDGLSNVDEKKYGTDINNPDTDGDGFLDGDEVKNGFNPLGK